MINPVNEGLTGVWIIVLGSGIIGNNIWNRQILGLKIPLHDAFMYVNIVLVFLNTAFRLSY